MGLRLFWFEFSSQSLHHAFIQLLSVGWARALRMMPRLRSGSYRQYTSLRIGRAEGRPRSGEERNDSRNQGIRKDEFVGGAVSVESSTAFPAWTEGGKVFYKVRQNALDPRNFKDTNDVGTITVRYVVIAQGEKNTVLRIDAVFVEDFRRRAHASDGSVENAEYKDIHDRVEAMQLMRDRTAEAERERQKAAQAKFDANDGSQMSGPAPEPVPETVTEKRETRVADTASIEEIQKKIHELQQQIQKKVKAWNNT